MTAPQTPATPPADTNTPPAGTTPASTGAPAEGGDGGSATETPATDGTPPADEWADFDAERAKQTILNQRKSESDLKAQLAAERKRVEEFERAKMSEAERVAAEHADAIRERDEARAEVAETRARQAFDAAATAAGILPNALRAARAIAADVATTDESGTIVLDDAAIASLKADHGYLFTPPQAAPQRVTFGAAAGQVPSGSPTSLTPEQVAFAQKAGLSPEDFAKFAGRTR